MAHNNRLTLILTTRPDGGTRSPSLLPSERQAEGDGTNTLAGEDQGSCFATLVAYETRKGQKWFNTKKRLAPEIVVVLVSCRIIA
jgi:hypothetical protein